MKNNKETAGHEDKLAKVIAEKIIMGKSAFASVLNKRFNSYSNRKQKRLFAGCCGIGVLSILISLMLSFRNVPGSTILNSKLTRPAGTIRDPPGKGNPATSTDSLTINQQTNGKSTTDRSKSGTP